ncbi:22687_t:CDS:1, partial [Gigaspora rosea]
PKQKTKNILSGNSNLFEWTWPLKESMNSYILAQEIPNIGE